MFTHELNDTAANAALDELAAVMSDMTPCMQEIGEFLTTSTKDRFATGEAPDSTPWAPKSEVTKEAYRKRGDKVDDRPLFGPSGELSRQIFSIVTPDSVTWGSPMIYARVMQMGATQGTFGAFIGKDKLGRDHFHHLPWGDIPARPFLGLSESDDLGIQDIVGEYLGATLQGR